MAENYTIFSVAIESTNCPENATKHIRINKMNLRGTLSTYEKKT